MKPDRGLFAKVFEKLRPLAEQQGGAQLRAEKSLSAGVLEARLYGRANGYEPQNVKTESRGHHGCGLARGKGTHRRCNRSVDLLQAPIHLGIGLLRVEIEHVALHKQVRKALLKLGARGALRNSFRKL